MVESNCDPMIPMIKFTVLSLIFISASAYEYYYATSDRKVNDTLLVVVDPYFMYPKYKGLEKVVEELVSNITNKYLKGESLKITFTNRMNYRLKEDVTAIFSITSCSDIWDIFQRLNDDGILYMALTDPDCPRLPQDYGITVPLYEPGFELAQIFLDLRTQGFLDWETVTIIFDETINTDLIDRVTGVFTKIVPLTKKSSSITLYKITGTQNRWTRKKEVQNLLKLLPRTDKFLHFIIIVQIELLPIILEEAKLLGLTHPKAHWLFVRNQIDKSQENNITNYVHLLHEGENVAFISNHTSTRFSCEFGLYCLVEEMLEYLAVSLRQSLQEEKMFSEQVTEEEWDLIQPTKAQRRLSVINFMKTRQKGTGRCDNCTLWKMQSSETWGSDFAHKKQLIESGDWSPFPGPLLTDQIFPNVAHGFRQRRIPIFTFHNPPWQIVKYDEFGKPSEVKGVIFEVVNQLAKSLNFTYEVILMSNSSNPINSTNSYRFDESVGDVVLDQSTEFYAWDYVVTLLQNKKVLLGAAAFTVTENRKKLLNFTSTIKTENYAFLVSRPKELSRALLFILPFTSNTWLCIIVAVLIMTPLLNAVQLISPFYEHYSHRGIGGYTKMMNCFWYIYGALLQQGGGVMPEANSGRLVIGTWWLVVLVLVTTYSGNLVAFLTFPKMDKVISNVDLLMERRSSLTWGMPEVSTLHSILKSTDNEKLNELSDGAKMHQKLTGAIVNEIRLGRHVYIDRKSTLLYIMKQEYMTSNHCGLSIGEEEFLAEHLAMAVSPDSSYLEMIDKQIKQMHKVGLINKWMEAYLPKKDQCWSKILSSDSQTHTVNLDDMQGSFFLLFLGITLGFILIIAEFIHRKWKSTQEKQVIHPFIP